MEIAFTNTHDLGLCLQPPKRGGVNDASSVALVFVAVIILAEWLWLPDSLTKLRVDWMAHTMGASLISLFIICWM